MDIGSKELWGKLRSKEIDINNKERFLSIVTKGFLYKLNQDLVLRGIPVPHYILNTGDDIMYLEVKGQDHSIEPQQVSNENFIYSQIPRCIIQPAGINIPTDQLTSPYSYGTFEVEDADMIYAFRAEFRRMPLNMTYSLKYYFDSFTDAMDITQQIITNLAFINNYNITYLGQRIPCSYNIPEDYQTEFMLEFDGITTDSKTRTISLELVVQTNMPVIHTGSLIPADAYIKQHTMKLDPDYISGDDYDLVSIRMSPSSGKEYSMGLNVYPKGEMKKGRNEA